MVKIEWTLPGFSLLDLSSIFTLVDNRFVDQPVTIETREVTTGWLESELRLSLRWKRSYTPRKGKQERNVTEDRP